MKITESRLRQIIREVIKESTEPFERDQDIVSIRKYFEKNFEGDKFNLKASEDEQHPIIVVISKGHEYTFKGRKPISDLYDMILEDSRKNRTAKAPNFFEIAQEKGLPFKKL
tara:strand:+ start:96 stop:431 length:336 start_codon:yes stop_codon:yes gene_type:complete